VHPGWDHRSGKWRSRDVGAHLQIVAEEDFLAPGAETGLRIAENAVDLAKAVNQAECVALVSGDCRADAVAGLLPMVKIGVEANIRAEMQIGAERVTLLVELIGADLGCRRERRARAGCSCRSCRGGDREVSVIRIVVPKPRLAVQGEVDLTLGAQGNEFERVEKVARPRRIPQITVIFFISLDIRIAPARALSFVKPDLVFGRGFTLGPGFGR